MSLLTLRDLTCLRGSGPGAFRLEIPALSLNGGEAVAITGPSGCGKSTLLDLLGLVLRPQAGEGGFRFDGQDVASLWRRGKSDILAAMRASRIGYVLQTGGLLPFLSVRGNIALSRKLLGLPEDGLTEALVTALKLEPLLNKLPRALSIGERQRVAIARALAHRPTLLLADEPTSSLDPANADTVMTLLLQLVTKMGVSAMVVSHDWALMERYGLRRIEAELAGGVTRFRS
ncbi:ABC transporter ATP-binding protein [Magnetospirillum molischianum]|uniref:Lipoprotein-releasing system ATP-binding protein LolD n=1 Tax=Magnetospirillum molischianum DSM 120 TaxID=1150626 RepID=H8FWQ7_MAGML|nr:ABC transporter ATP-binding protein [Magnetospirillum molischianum]CCG42795.1 Lipoprotein-releasing system ATP-binding protein LolD [Magnetospirillum molischianum DSM 120]